MRTLQPFVTPACVLFLRAKDILYCTVLYCTDPLRGQNIGFCYSDPCTPIGIIGIRSASSDRELAKEHSFCGAAVLSMHLNLENLAVSGSLSYPGYPQETSLSARG